MEFMAHVLHNAFRSLLITAVYLPDGRTLGHVSLAICRVGGSAPRSSGLSFCCVSVLRLFTSAHSARDIKSI